MLRNSLGTRNVFYVMRLAANSLPSTMQILLVNVKDVGDSIATLINWLLGDHDSQFTSRVEYFT